MKLVSIDVIALRANLAQMPLLRNARHERFAQLVASGKYSDMEAFRLVGYSETGKGNAARLRDNER